MERGRQVLPTNLELAYLLHVQAGGRTVKSIREEFPSQEYSAIRHTLSKLRSKGYIWNERRYMQGLKGQGQSAWWLTGMGEEMVLFVKKWVEVK
jgi:hypothetical protein